MSLAYLNFFYIITTLIMLIWALDGVVFPFRKKIPLIVGIISFGVSQAIQYFLMTSSLAYQSGVLLDWELLRFIFFALIFILSLSKVFFKKIPAALINTISMLLFLFILYLTTFRPVELIS